MKRLLVVLAAVAGISIAVWVSVGDSDPAADPAAPTASQRGKPREQVASGVHPRAPARVRLGAQTSSTEVDALRAELAELRAQIEDGAPEPRAEPEPSSAAEIAAAELELAQDYRAQLDDLLASESSGSAWARRTRPELEAVFGEWAPKSTVRNARCGESLCRLELHHDDPSGHDQLLSQLHDGFPWSGAATIQRPEGEHGRLSIIYVAPEGQPLPDHNES